jgi:predicted amidohydrolase YtcJ
MNTINVWLSEINHGCPTEVSMKIVVVHGGKSAGKNLSYGSVEDTNDKKYYKPLWEAERVSVQEMLTAYTYNGAYSYAMEDITGSIETGKSADFVVLDENIFSSKQEHIRDIKINRRVFRGE